MLKQNLRFEYAHQVIPIILKSSSHADIYYGMDELEMKKIKIVLAKYSSHTDFLSLPNKVTVGLHPFKWNQMGQSYRIDMDKKVSVQLNTLVEVVANQPIFSQG